MENREFMATERAGCLSSIFYCWIHPFLWKSYKHGLEKDDLPRCAMKDSCNANYKRFESMWLEELQNNKNTPSLQRVTWRFIRSRAILSSTIWIIDIIIGLIAPAFFLRNFVDYLGNQNFSYLTALGWASGWLGLEITRIMLHNAYYAVLQHAAIGLRSGLFTLLYHKLLKLQNLGNKSAEEVVNMFSNDNNNIFVFIYFFTGVLLSPPITIIGCGITIWYLLSLPAVIGVVIFSIAYPVQYMLAAICKRLRTRTAEITDQRVRLTKEMASNMKFIKMYAWEKCFKDNIIAQRFREQKLLEKADWITSIILAMAQTVLFVAPIPIFLIHVSCGYQLYVPESIAVLCIFIRLQAVFQGEQRAPQALFQMKVSLERIQSLLLMDEKVPYVKRSPTISEHSVVVTDASFAWNSHAENGVHNLSYEGIEETKQGDTRTSLKKAPPRNNNSSVLTDINFKLKRGKLLGVCGSVGSGKSSLLSALLEQVHLLKGEVVIEGSVAYVSQQAWIINATVKQNILLGSPLEYARYQKAIACCGLQPDINSFMFGDDTEIGERGINLSGGQKQRISLARAVYSNRDIYLLDDPLSAVDVHVGLHIFQHCIKEALNGKSVIFVTHQLQYLQDCDSIVLLKDGKITEKGTHEQLMSQNGEYSALIHMYQPEQKAKPTKANKPQVKRKSENHLSVLSAGVDKIQNILLTTNTLNKGTAKSIGPILSGNLITAETMKTGNIDFSTYYTYIKASGGFCFFFIVMLAFGLNIGITSSSGWILSTWLNQTVAIYSTEQNNANSENKLVNTHNFTFINENISTTAERIAANNYNYEIEYAVIISLIILTSAFRSYLFTKAAINASTNLHHQVLENIIVRPMSFFDSTPIGRLLNIFSKDMDEIDVHLPVTAELFLQCAWIVAFSVVFISLVFPLVLLPAILTGIVAYFFTKYFLPTVRTLKRIEIVSRSSVYGHVNTTAQGLTAIQAYGKSEHFSNIFVSHFERNNSPLFLFNASTRTFAYTMDFATISIAITTAIFTILTHSSVSPAFAGLALVYASRVVSIFQYSVRLYSDTQAHFTSVERFQQLIQNNKPEDVPTIYLTLPPSDWPLNGSIHFQSVSMRYRKDFPLVLKGVDFMVKPNEKIGIIGRTGSGKSSLSAALFRLVEIESGTIFIDSVDIASIALSQLRSKIAMIPQDPILFVGTVRFNLDPTNTCTDEEIWMALASTFMKERIQVTDKQLQEPVTENGENFSVGERQLLCLARVLLRKNKVIFLDEATAAVDAETDSLIQITIRESFKDCTILTVAHRLNTVVCCDRVMVMEDGMIKELDSPSALLNRPDSIFSIMMKASEQSF